MLVGMDPTLRPRTDRLARTLAVTLAVALGGASARALAQEPAEGRIIDRVVAIVEGQIITLSDLEFETAVRLVDKGGSEAATRELDAPALRTGLDYAINERLLSLEAEKLQAFVVDEKEVAGVAGKFIGRFESREAFDRFLSRHDAGLAQLFLVFKRRLRAERLLETRINLRVQASEAELQGERFHQLTRAELAQLRSAASIRLVAPPGDGT